MSFSQKQSGCILLFFKLAVQKYTYTRRDDGWIWFDGMKKKKKDQIIIIEIEPHPFNSAKIKIPFALAFFAGFLFYILNRRSR